MRFTRQVWRAIACTVLSLAPLVSMGQDAIQVLPLDNRPTIRFCDYSLESIAVAPVAFRSPLGTEIATNSYWEVEQVSQPVPPPPIDSPLNSLTMPGAVMGGCAGGCAAGGCAVGGCAAGGCMSGGCTSGGCTSGGCTSGGCCAGPDGCMCCDACKCCKPPCQLIAMVETTFFFPQLNREFLTNSLTNNGGTQNFRSDASNGSVDGSLLFSPRLTLGFQGCKWGLVGRYWNGTNWGSGFEPSIPGAALSGVNAFDGFKAYTADLLVQRRIVGCLWTNYAFAGVRYASLNNDRYLGISNSFDDQLFSTSAYTSQQFVGPGVAFGFWGFRPIQDCSPFSLYYDNRYSFNFGRGTAIAQTTASASDTSGFATTTNGAEAGNDSTLFIAELQVGLQWNGKVACLPGTAFLRTGFEWQYWDTDGGVQAGADSVAFINTNNVSANAFAGDMLFHLIGLNIGAGLMF